ncbi:MAG: hypothetical protein J2P38_05010 [Candidatus Dormibacteraeota bacterium]|nr:hypothetical protein [Candidatus Dormibacteraeota bacterium]
MPSEGRPAPGAAGQVKDAPTVAHADGTLTLTPDGVQVDVTRGGGYRGTITVPLDRCTLRVMGRAIAVFDGGRLVHLCSRCKPQAEVARLVAGLGDRATSEGRTPFATLLALREESAAYVPGGDGPEEPPAADEQQVGPDAPAEIPPGYESLRRVYLSRAEMDRDSRRLRAAGWVEHQVALNQDVPEETAPRGSGRLRGLLRAASPSRDVTEGVVIWTRPLATDPEARERGNNPLA